MNQDNLGPRATPRASDERRRIRREATANTPAGSLDLAQILVDGLREMDIRLEKDEPQAPLESLAHSTDPQPRPRRT
jgi:hypothetical protein